MSREHKYRAYINNPIHGTGIFRVKSINLYPLVVTVIIPNGKYIDDIALSDEIQFFEGEVKLLEYTGIKDKNDKEIYEGYIIKVTWANGTKSINYIVKYAEDCAYYMLESIADEFELDTFCGFDTSQLEVLGNVFENPELLEK